VRANGAPSGQFAFGSYDLVAKIHGILAAYYDRRIGERSVGITTLGKESALEAQSSIAQVTLRSGRAGADGRQWADRNSCCRAA
jgi:hypothetical protein